MKSNFIYDFVFSFDTTSLSYKTFLPYDLNVCINYLFNPNNLLSLNIHSQIQHKNIYTIYNLSYTRSLNKNIIGAINYNIIDNSFNNIGLGLTINYKNTSIYFSSYNILSYDLLDFEKMAYALSIKFGFNSKEKNKKRLIFPRSRYRF